MRKSKKDVNKKDSKPSTPRKDSKPSTPRKGKSGSSSSDKLGSDDNPFGGINLKQQDSFQDLIVQNNKKKIEKEKQMSESEVI